MIDSTNLRDAAARFVAAFEQVFHDDWTYSCEQLRIHIESHDEATAQILKIVGEEPQPPTPREATFLRPLRDISSDNWGNYEALLATYAELKSALTSADGPRSV